MPSDSVLDRRAADALIAAGRLAQVGSVHGRITGTGSLELTADLSPLPSTALDPDQAALELCKALDEGLGGVGPFTLIVNDPDGVELVTVSAPYGKCAATAPR